MMVVGIVSLYLQSGGIISKPYFISIAFIKFLAGTSENFIIDAHEYLYGERKEGAIN